MHDPSPPLARVLAYSRVSTTNQAEDGYSLAAQAHELRRWAAYQRLDLVEPIFEDAGVSGRHNLRPGLEALISQLQPGDTVATYALSRLARGGAVQTLALVERIQAAGARLVLLKEQLDSATPTGRLLLVILAELALMESEQIRERSELGRLQAAREGRLPQGDQALPFGLSTDEEGWPVWDPVRSATVRRAFELRLTLALRPLAKQLKAEGHSPRRGGTDWDEVVLSKWFRNPAYKGELVYRQNKERLVIPVPPLVDEDTWNRVQAKGLGYRAHKNPERFPLSSHVVCTCGTSLVGLSPPPARPTHTRARHYACLPQLRGSDTCPTNGRARRLWPAEALEAAYTRAVGQLLENPSDPLRLRAAFGAEPTPDPHAGERTDTESMLAELLDLRLKGLVTRPAYEAQYAALNARLRALSVQPAPAPTPDVPDLSHLADLARSARGSLLAELLAELGLMGQARGESRGLRRGGPAPTVEVELLRFSPLDVGGSV